MRVRDSIRDFLFPEPSSVLPLPYALVAAFGILAGLMLASLDVSQRIEWSLYDRVVRIASRDPIPPNDIVVVAIDEISFDQIGLQWPWPRRLHAKLVDSLVRGGARTIVMDLLFDAPSNPMDDSALQQALKSAGNVVLGCERTVVTDRAYSVEQWIDPISPLAEAAAAIGAITIPLDPDGVVRHAAFAIDGRPGLALAAAQRERPYSTPGNADQVRLIHFAGAPRNGITTVSYYQALDAEKLLPRDIFKNKIVFVGRSLSSAATLAEAPDYVSTPVSMQMAGVEVHANILDTLLRHQEIADPFASYERLLVLCLIVSSLAALVLYRLDGLMSFVILIGSTGAFLTSAFVSLSQFYLRLPVVPPALSLVGVYATTAAYRFALVQRERRLIKRAFQHYVAPAIVERMLSDPSKLRLGGEEYEVSVLFSDLQGFTGIAEQLTPQQLRARLGSYFKDMMDVALAEQATLDKFIGDAIMLYFGCPVPDPAHPLQACRAALAMQRQLRKHNQEWRNYGAPELAMRIGINTGPVVAGNLGTDTIFNFTIIGDCVNLASRLEGANKEYGTFTIISEDTWCRVKGEFEARELDLIRVKGKVQPVRIYELAGFCAELSQQRKALHASFAEGLNFYRQQRWNEALSAFQGALEVDAHDGPSKTFIRRCEYYARTPRIEDWDFVHTMHVK